MTDKYQQIDDFFGSARRVMLFTVWFRFIASVGFILAYAGLIAWVVWPR